MNARPHRRALIATALAAGACARQEAGVTTTRFWSMGNEAAAVPALVQNYLKENAGVSVDVQALPWSAAHERLLTAFAGHALPDMAQLGNTWVSELAAVNALSEVPKEHRDLLQGHFPGVLETNRIGARYLAVPWYVDTRLLFYRTDTLDRAGIGEPPKTWDAWKRAMHGVKRVAGDGNYAMLMPLNEFELLLTLGLQQSEPLLREEGGRGNFSNPGFVSALEFYKSCFDEKLAPVVTAAQISNVWNEFARGYFSFFFSGPWSVGDIRARLPANLQDRWSTADMPGPNGPGASAAGGSSLVVFKSSRDPAAAWRVVRYLLSPEAQFDFHEATGDLPAKVAAWSARSLADDPRMRAFASQLRRAKPVPKAPEWERIVTEMQVVADRMVRGEYTPKAAAAEIDARADALLEKRRWMLERGRAT